MTESSGIRVALINPPVRTNDVPRFIPYGLGILAGVINELGHDVAISDCNAERVDRETFRKLLTSHIAEDHKGFDVFGIGGIISTYGWQKEIIPLLRKDHPSSLIIAGGGCASSLQENMLRWIPELDMVCVGEGEKTFPEILEHVWDRDFSNVKGIVYRDKDKIVPNERRPLMTEKELNELPYPLWSQLPMEEVYFRNSPIMLSAQAMVAKRRLDVIGERGCNHVCTYCFTSDTIVLGNSFAYPIGDIVNNNFTSKVLNKDGEWGLVSQHHKHHYSGKMLRLKVGHVPRIQLTPNHEVYVWDFPVIKDSEGRVKARKWNEGKLVKKSANILKPSQLGNGNFRDNDYLFVPIPEKEESSGLSKEQLWLVGIYLAEGSLPKGRRQSLAGVAWSFGKHEHELHLRTENAIEEVLRAAPKSLDTKTTHRIYINSKKWAEWFSQFGDGAENKRLPHKWMSFPCSELMSVLEGYMDGDGSDSAQYDKRRFEALTKSTTLGHQLFLISSKLGNFPSIRKRHVRDSYIEGRVVKGGDFWHVYWPDTESSRKSMRRVPGGLAVSLQRIEEFDYDGDVYNLGVEEEHSYTANLVAVSNCYHCDMGGDYLGKDAQGRDQILRPVSRWQSARYVVDMIKYARIRMGIDFVWFGEENFLSNRKRAYEICDLLEKENLVGALEGSETVPVHIGGGVMWGCLGSPETADEVLYNRMRECGCTYVDYGFESANNDRLKEIHKGVTVEQEQRALDITINARLNPVATFMVGYPGETVQSIYDTTAFWVRNGILCTPFFITPYPRTRLFEANKEKILKQFGAVPCKREDGSTFILGEDRKYEEFVLKLGDATDLVVNLSPFSDVELLGLRELMRLHDLTRIKEFALKKGTPIVESKVTLAPPTPALKINEGMLGNAI